MKWTPQIQLSSQSPQVLVVTWYFESSPCIIYVLWVSFTYQVTSLNQSDSSNSLGARLEPWVATFSLFEAKILTWTARSPQWQDSALETNPMCSYPLLSLFPVAKVTFKRIKLCRSSHISRGREDPYESILEIHRWWHPPSPSRCRTFLHTCVLTLVSFWVKRN